MSKRMRNALIIGIIVLSLLLLLLRFIYPLADPPLNVSNSFDVFTDEGFFILGQRAILFTDYKPLGDFNTFWVNPVYYLWNLISLWITGLSRLNFRLFHIFTIINLTLLSILLWHIRENKHIVLLLIASSFTLMGFSRLGISDSLGVFFQLLIFISYLRHKKGSFWHYGIILSILILFKAIYLPLYLLISFDIVYKHFKERRKEVIFFLLLSTLPIIAWYICLVIACPNWKTYLAYYGTHLCLDPVFILKTIYRARRNPLFTNNLVILLLGGISSIAFLLKKNRSREEYLTSAYMLLVILSFILLKHKVTRYFLIMIPLSALLIQMALNNYVRHLKIIVAMLLLHLAFQGYLFISYFARLKYTQVEMDREFAQMAGDDIIAGNPPAACCFGGRFKTFPVWIDYFNSFETLDRIKPKFLCFEENEDEWVRFMKKEGEIDKYKVFGRHYLGKRKIIILERI